jgi:LPS-assembly lipoprotein
MLLRNRRMGRIWALCAAGLGLSLTLTGCGFTPLYGYSRDKYSVNHYLASVYIAEVNKRVAQLVRNRLISIMSPPGAEGPSKYRLEIFPFESERDTLVRSDADVKRRIYNLRVSYKLFLKAGNKPVSAGAVLAVSPYSRVSSEFANVRARRDAVRRAAVTAADDIKIRLAAYFATL